jgi:hypothetical protein
MFSIKAVFKLVAKLQLSNAVEEAPASLDEETLLY